MTENTVTETPEKKKRAPTDPDKRLADLERQTAAAKRKKAKAVLFGDPGGRHIWNAYLELNEAISERGQVLALTDAEKALQSLIVTIAGSDVFDD